MNTNNAFETSSRADQPVSSGNAGYTAQGENDQAARQEGSASFNNQSQLYQEHQVSQPHSNLHAAHLHHLRSLNKNDTQKMFMAGGILLAIGAFLIVLNSSPSSHKASLTDPATSPTVGQSVAPQEEVKVIVYKDQYGNVLTEEQMQQILQPQTVDTTSAAENTGNTQTGETGTQNPENTGDNPSYPPVQYTEEQIANIQVNEDKTLYVKESDTERLVAENKIVQKVVNNTPVYVEPISGAVIEFIKPIERPVIGNLGGRGRKADISEEAKEQIIEKYGSSSSEIAREETVQTTASSTEVSR
jgi:hypothetical protein